MFLPSSFFPNIGGVQGSILNLVKHTKFEKRPVFLLGINSFIFSYFKKREFIIIPYPYKLFKNFPILEYSYLKILVFILKPSYFWLYGGGVTAARILSYKKNFTQIKFIIRSSGEDVQVNNQVAYGLSKQDRYFIKTNYKHADLAWALSDEIKNIYINELDIPYSRILVKPNYIFQNNNSKATKEFQSKSNRIIGIIGRYHPKKQFDLAVEVSQLLPEYKFYFKTPNYNPPSSSNIYKIPSTKVKHLNQWPQDDVFDFYKSIDLLLVCSAIESFGNVNFEAAVNGVPVLISNTTTGGEILEQMGYLVYFYNNFDALHITDKIHNIFKDIKNSRDIPVYKNPSITDFLVD